MRRLPLTATALTLGLLISCGQSETASTTKEQKARDAKVQELHARFISRHPKAKAFEIDDEWFGDTRLTLDVQRDIAENPSQSYWLETDAFDIYQSGNGHVIFSCKVHDDLLRLVCSDGQAQLMIAAHPRGSILAKFIILFSLTKVAPLGIEIATEGESSEDRQPVAADIRGRIYEGHLDDVELLEEGTKF
jgi:hypothetical protein